MSWVVLAVAAPFLSALGVAVWKITARIFGRAAKATWVEAVADAVKPQFDAVHDKLDQFRVENEQDHAKVRERLDGMNTRLEAVERAVTQHATTQVVVNNPGGASAQT
jgi:hypothetical protein